MFRKSTRPAFRPVLEPLESRLTPSTYTVSSLADSGDGSLRAAITSVNADTTPDEIDFSVAGIIQLTSGALPTIANTVKINGRSAPGFAGAPLVEINFNNFDGLTFNAANSLLASLSLGNSGATGLTIEGSDNSFVIGNYIGLALDGSALSNKGVGIDIHSSGNTIGGTAPGTGNVIAFNSVGVRVSGGSGNPILGNSIHDNGIGIQLNGGNLNQPSPFLVFAIQTGATTKINGILNAAADAMYSVQIFASPAEPGSQANTLLGTVFTTSNASGVAGFTLSAQAPANSVFTSVATSAFGNSSEISHDVGLTGTANEAYVSGAYGFFFHRGQDAFSNVWVDQLNAGVSAETLLIELQASDEYLKNQVAALYNQYLQRSPDIDGGVFWLNSLKAGGTFEQVAEGLTSSPEYFPLQGGTNQGFVTGLYRNVLNRSATDADVTGWVATLNSGASRLNVSVAFLTSQEYRTDLVQADYRMFLLRPPEFDALTAWTNAMNAGFTDQQVLAGIFGSAEGFQIWS